jgi:uncharacterized membrane protein
LDREFAAMSFEWKKIHKWQENHERNITDDVYEYVLVYYDADAVENLTQEQINEIQAYRDELDEYSIMKIGFSNLINQWENQ